MVDGQSSAGGHAAESPGSIRHILVCLDGSDAGEKSLPHALALAEVVGARMTLVRVLEGGIVKRLARGRADGVAVVAEQLCGETEGGAITAKAYRDRSGIGRNLSIEVLEYFDKTGFTKRIGNTREIRRSAASVFGGGAVDR